MSSIPTAMAEDDIFTGHLRSHIIQQNDTLYDIARHYGVSVPELLDANPGTDRWQPESGKILVIPAWHIGLTGGSVQ